MMIPVTVLALVTQLTVTIADAIPHFNLEPVCHGFGFQEAALSEAMSGC
jgi:hypothetical protein